MWGRFAALAFLAAFVPANGAMSAASRTPLGQCHIAGDEKLHGTSVGADAICAEIERAIAAQAPSVGYRVEIIVLSASRLSANLVVNGRSLPAQNFAVMDRDLNAGSIVRFANSLAAIVAEASKR